MDEINKLVAKTTIPPEKFQHAVLSMLVEVSVKQTLILDHLLLLRANGDNSILENLVDEDVSESQKQWLNVVRELQNAYGV